MKKKTRSIILFVCVASFLVVAPVLVFYSMGYRYDFPKNKITKTGGIYVRTFPSADQVTIDSKISQKPGFLANSVFVQSLLPDNHTVLVKKAGYFDYFKTLPVLEQQVTKLENILLIKNSVAFNAIAEKINYFSISSDNKNILTAGPATKSLGFQYFALASQDQKKTFLLSSPTAKVLEVKWSNDSNKALIKLQNLGVISYYIFDNSKTVQPTTPLLYLDKNSQQISFNPQNSQEIFYVENKILYSLKNNKALAIIKNVIAYKPSNGVILWLSGDGLLSSSDISGKLIQKMTAKNLAISINNKYEILVISNQTFVRENDILLAYNPETKTLENFASPINNYKVLSSPDGQNMVYYNANDIYLYTFSKDAKQNNIKLFSSKYPETISNCYWLNNDYLIFESGNKIIISEIDYRGNINAVELPQTYGKSADSKNPQIYFDSQNSKVYVLNGATLYSSEKLTP